jgi:hypothetical protein
MYSNASQGKTMLIKPTDACPNCWRAWFTGPRNAIGYCWHGKVAWGVKSGPLAVVPGVTREEHRAMLEYLNEMESLVPVSRSSSDVAQGSLTDRRPVTLQSSRGAAGHILF